MSEHRTYVFTAKDKDGNRVIDGVRLTDDDNDLAIGLMYWSEDMEDKINEMAVAGSVTIEISSYIDDPKTPLFNEATGDYAVDTSSDEDGSPSLGDTFHHADGSTR